MEYIFGIFKELLTLFRVSKEEKSKEIEAKNKEDFKDREKKQQDVSQKDKDEQLIRDVVNSVEEEERQIKLEEIRKVIAK